MPRQICDRYSELREVPVHYWLGFPCSLLTEPGGNVAGGQNIRGDAQLPFDGCLQTHHVKKRESLRNRPYLPARPKTGPSLQKIPNA